MALAHFGMLICKLVTKDIYKVPETSPVIIFDIKYSVCTVNNGEDTKLTRNTARRGNFVRNGDNCKIHKIKWCDGDLKLE